MKKEQNRLGETQMVCLGELGEDASGFSPKREKSTDAGFYYLMKWLFQFPN